MSRHSRVPTQNTPPGKSVVQYKPCCVLSTNRRNTTECSVKNVLRNCWTELNIWMLTGLIEIQIRPIDIQALFCSQALDDHGQLTPHVHRRCRRKPIPPDRQGFIERAGVGANDVKPGGWGSFKKIISFADGKRATTC